MGVHFTSKYLTLSIFAQSDTTCHIGLRNALVEASEQLTVVLSIKLGSICLYLFLELLLNLHHLLLLLAIDLRI